MSLRGAAIGLAVLTVHPHDASCNAASCPLLSVAWGSSLFLLSELGFVGSARPRCDTAHWVVAVVAAQAHSIAWTIHALLDHPDVEARLLAEFSSALPPPGTPFTPAHLSPTALPYADAVWRETLRRYPPVPLGTARRLTADLVLPSDGSVIPAGTAVHAPIYPLHHHPHVFLAPEAFDPARWLPPASPGGGGYTAATRRAARAHWVPFLAGGGRACPGHAVAAVEWAALLAAVLRRYRLVRAGASADVRAESAMTLRPVGVWVTLHRRETR